MSFLFRTFLVFPFLFVLHFSCAPPQICTPKEKSECTCSENTKGTKICSDDGSAYSACSCPNQEPPKEYSHENDQEEMTLENILPDERFSEESPKEKTPDAGHHEENTQIEKHPEPEQIVEKECTPNTTRSCYDGPTKTNNIGECKPGQQICSKEGAWSLCLGQILPTQELCNGKDNDCNGMTDDTYPEKDKACDTQKPGICKDGVYQCLSGLLKCKQTNTPKTEECNNIDDDCDGQIDEELKQDCYSGPSQTEGVGTCKKGEQTCTAGKWGLCSGEIIPQSEVCNGKDDDCNGIIDQSYAPKLCPANQTCETGVCLVQCKEDADCPNKTNCQNGLCKSFTCQSPLQACVHTCIDVSSNAEHCGACYQSCSSIQACSNSACVCDLNTAQICNGVCTDVSFNDANCGTCGTTCTNGKLCFQKKCSDSWARDIILGRTSVLTTGLTSITVDVQGNTYIGGNFEKSATFGNTTLTTLNFDMYGSAFLAKLDKNGNWLWVKRVVNSSNDRINALTSDTQGNIYAAGYFGSGAKFGNITPGSGNMFVAKLNSNGTWLWVQTRGNTYASSLKYSNNAIYIFGKSASTNLFTGKVNATTGAWLWGKTAGSKSTDYIGEFGLDSSDNLYISCGVGPNAKFGSISLKNTKTIGILAKIDKNGNWLWAKPGLYSDMTTDPQGNSYLIGRFSNSFTIGTCALTIKGTRDMYIAKFDTNGICTWAKSYGVAGGYTGSSIIKYLPNGDLYILGSSSKSLKLGSYTVDLTKSTFFEAKMDTNGNWKALRQRIVTSSGSLANFGFAISNGRLYGAGEYSGVVTIGGYTLPASYQGIVWSLPTF